MTLLTTELQPTKTYPFSTLRYQSQHDPAQEGVFAAGDMLVAQRAAGTNMSVDVAAGAGWVQGDDAVRQGLYHQVNDASVNVAVSAAHATLPRLDQVVLQLADSSVLGGSDTPLLMVLTGTATSGATLDNRTGAAALPNTCIRLGDLLVPALATQIVNANIRDRRPWCRGVYYATRRTAGDYSTSSTTYVDIDTPTLSPRLEVQSTLLLVTLHGTVQSTGNDMFFTALVNNGYVDGVTSTAGGHAGRGGSRNASSFEKGSISMMLTVAPGSNYIRPQFRCGGAGTTFLMGSAANTEGVLEFQEIPRQNSNNSPAGYG